MLTLRRPVPEDLVEIRAAYARSEALHHPWTWAPEDFERYLAQQGRYFVCPEGGDEILGTFNISGVIRGLFQSGYLGYEVFCPHQRKGIMREALGLLLNEAFGTLALHRLEANIQPGNEASIRLVAGAGFVREGFSRRYLRVGGGEWKDHERWAIVNDDWVER
ncbi:GNAT family N-acetyltransferase [Niveibacterium terrae]|uniref:GNAT family N-acetyltransferase n=1 Tax=Niveibacterium terrae TaxID=3373598 RepID=UPI003A90E355